MEVRRENFLGHVKVCNQVLVAVIFAGLAESLVLGSKLGVDP
jgi:3-hydroxyisobutyrate dehydrogenase-like beta-hydroxyacid dehydrogenase